MALKMQFWFEFASTYSYPAVMRVEELSQQHGISVQWKPFLLGPLFRSQGWNDSPFNIYPAKGKYMWRDLERVCEEDKIPFKKPSQFPRGSVLAARIVCLNEREPWCTNFIQKVFKANFFEDLDISKREIIAKILESIHQPASEIIEKALSDENKERLRKQTEEAQKRGIFGAPTFLIGDEMFWGNDRLEAALQWYNKKGKEQT